MHYLCITPEREGKTRMMMTALAAGAAALGEPHRVVLGEPPDDGAPFALWGQEWLALRTLPQAFASGRPFWHIDNGFWDPARGRSVGYYRITYRGMTPVLLPREFDPRAATVRLKPWRSVGKFVLLAMPGIHFGIALGIDVPGWCTTIEARLREATKRPIRVRTRDSRAPLSRDFDNCWCCVTHSSNVAVDAAIAGIPVFVEPTSPAAPIGRTDLDIEAAVTPGREMWLRSLASQHFTLDEMRSGIAMRWMRRIAEFVDHAESQSRGD